MCNARKQPWLPSLSLRPSLNRNVQPPRYHQADPTKVGTRAKKRGLPQLGTLGAGNHYAEIQVVEEILDARAAARMGVDQIGQVRCETKRRGRGPEN